MESEMGEHYNLKWNSHHAETFRAFESHRINESLVDVVLFCDGSYIKAHKLVLSACSVYFEKLFHVTGTSREPVLIFRDAGVDILRLAVEFMYNGEVEVPSEKLPQFILLAESLEIKGLRAKDDSEPARSLAGAESPVVPVEEQEPELEPEPEVGTSPPPAPAEPSTKKRRLHGGSLQRNKTTNVRPADVSVIKPDSRRQSSIESFPLSPPGLQRASSPFLDEKPLRNKKSRGSRPSSSSDTGKSSDSAPEDGGDIYLDGSDEAEFGDEAIKAEESSACDLENGKNDDEFYVVKPENMDVDRPHHVPADITVEGPSPELNGLFRGRDQRGRLVYLCGFCQYTATKKTHGIDHVRIHLGDRPFACSICGRKFTRKQHMRKHEILHQVKESSHEVIELGCDSPVESPDDVRSEHDSSNGPDSLECGQSGDGDGGDFQ